MSNPCPGQKINVILGRQRDEVQLLIYQQDKAIYNHLRCFKWQLGVVISVLDGENRVSCFFPNFCATFIEKLRSVLYKWAFVACNIYYIHVCSKQWSNSPFPTPAAAAQEFHDPEKAGAVASGVSKEDRETAVGDSGDTQHHHAAINNKNVRIS